MNAKNKNVIPGNEDDLEDLTSSETKTEEELAKIKSDAEEEAAKIKTDAIEEAEKIKADAEEAAKIKADTEETKKKPSLAELNRAAHKTNQHIKKEKEKSEK